MEEDEDGEQTGSRVVKIVAGDEASSGQHDQNSTWNVQAISSPPHTSPKSFEDKHTR